LISGKILSGGRLDGDAPLDSKVVRLGQGDNQNDSDRDSERDSHPDEDCRKHACLHAPRRRRV
jgi:hypothetical protein